MRDLGKEKAAFGGHRSAALGSGEASQPLFHSTRSSTALQEPIYAKTERAYNQARRLAIYHAALAERFISEAERLGALAQALKCEAP